MERIKFILRAMVFVIAGLFLHYVLPQHDVVKLTSTEIIRTDFGGFNRIFYAQADSGAVLSQCDCGARRGQPRCAGHPVV